MSQLEEQFEKACNQIGTNNGLVVHQPSGVYFPKHLTAIAEAHSQAQTRSCLERVKVMPRVSFLKPDGVSREAFNQAKEVFNARIDAEIQILGVKDE